MTDDPCSHFFPNGENVDLYKVLQIQGDARPEDIKKAYRSLALKYHPDKHTNGTAASKRASLNKFQQIGFAYAVLSDPERKKRYDKTGRTDEAFDITPEDGWSAYFQAMFERVTREKLDDMKKEYQGSTTETDDLKSAYLDTDGCIGDIMTRIPHSTYEDESRFALIISQLIKQGVIPSLKNWDITVKDKKAKLSRRRKGEKEAEEAEELAKKLGVWNDFYGGEGSSETIKTQDDDSALRALILGKQKNADGFLDRLAAKYTEPVSRPRKGKKRILEEDQDRQARATPDKMLRTLPTNADNQASEEAIMENKTSSGRRLPRGNRSNTIAKVK